MRTYTVSESEIKRGIPLDVGGRPGLLFVAGSRGASVRLVAAREAVRAGALVERVSIACRPAARGESTAIRVETEPAGVNDLRALVLVRLRQGSHCRVDPNGCGTRRLAGDPGRRAFLYLLEPESRLTIEWQVRGIAGSAAVVVTWDGASLRATDVGAICLV